MGGLTTGVAECYSQDSVSHRALFPGGIRINVSTKDIRRYDGLPIEWNGVPPDIRVEQTAEDIRQGRDKQLEYALQLLR